MEVFYFEFLHRIPLVELWGIRSGPQEGRLGPLNRGGMSGPGVDSKLLTKCTVQMICHKINKDTMRPVADFLLPCHLHQSGIVSRFQPDTVPACQFLAGDSISGKMWFYRPKQPKQLFNSISCYFHILVEPGLFQTSVQPHVSRKGAMQEDRIFRIVYCQNWQGNGKTRSSKMGITLM